MHRNGVVGLYGRTISLLFFEELVFHTGFHSDSTNSENVLPFHYIPSSICCHFFLKKVLPNLQE